MPLVNNFVAPNPFESWLLAMSGRQRSLAVRSQTGGPGCKSHVAHAYNEVRETRSAAPAWVESLGPSNRADSLGRVLHKRMMACEHARAAWNRGLSSAKDREGRGSKASVKQPCRLPGALI